jgi:hypothetical protein
MYLLNETVYYVLTIHTGIASWQKYSILRMSSCLERGILLDKRVQACRIATLYQNRKEGSMMADQPTPQFTETDVQSLGRKLAEFSQALAPGEWAVFTGILQRAFPAGGDVQGFSYEPHSDQYNRKLLVVGLLDILYPDDLSSDEPYPDDHSPDELS